MKKLIFILFGFMFCCNSNGQVEKEKPVSKSFLYSNETMKQLEYIVDSLNIRFKNCNFNKTYYSVFQARAHYVYLETGDIKEAIKDMDNQMSYEKFIKKYRRSTVKSDLPVVKYKAMDYSQKEVVVFESYLSNESIISFEPQSYNENMKGKWLYNYQEKDKYSSARIGAFYFITEFESKALPEVYNRMVQYSECMVDTNTQIFSKKAQRVSRGLMSPPAPKVDSFMNYLDSMHWKPDSGTMDQSVYMDRLNQYKLNPFFLIDSVLVHTVEFNTLLKEAVNQALKTGRSNDEFEEYVARYYSKKAALELKRGRRLMGTCSMDNSPQMHVKNIAELAAESLSWEIFLRAHLDIMNDRFDRVSDNSVAWPKRMTYIGELEELDILVPDLLFGVSFRIENGSPNHYYGSNSRIGRAFAESEDIEAADSMLISMIRNQELDDYNRFYMYYLYLNFLGYLPDNIDKNAKKIKLEEAKSTMPEYLKKYINSK